MSNICFSISAHFRNAFRVAALREECYIKDQNQSAGDVPQSSLGVNLWVRSLTCLRNNPLKGEALLGWQAHPKKPCQVQDRWNNCSFNEKMYFPSQNSHPLVQSLTEQQTRGFMNLSICLNYTEKHGFSISFVYLFSKDVTYFP